MGPPTPKNGHFGPFWSVTQKRKVEKSIQRCQIDRLVKGYKRAIDKIQGPIAKNGFSGQKWPKSGHFGPFWSVTRKRKLKKSIVRCQIDCLAKGYKRAIDEIRDPIAKNGFSGQNPARWPENSPPSGRTASKNQSEGAKSKISSRVTNGPLTKSGVQ